MMIRYYFMKPESIAKELRRLARKIANALRNGKNVAKYHDQIIKLTKVVFKKNKKHPGFRKEVYKILCIKN